VILTPEQRRWRVRPSLQGRLLYVGTAASAVQPSLARPGGAPTVILARHAALQARFNGAEATWHGICDLRFAQSDSRLGCPYVGRGVGARELALEECCRDSRQDAGATQGPPTLRPIPLPAIACCRGRCNTRCGQSIRRECPVLRCRRRAGRRSYRHCGRWKPGGK
jgi:hypothetical protein